MKVTLHREENLQEDELVLRYKQMNRQVQQILEIAKYPVFRLEGVLEEERYILDCKDIYYFHTVDRKTFAYLKEKVCKVNYSIGELEEKLIEVGFVRINKSVIVNVYKLMSMKQELNMRIVVQLANGENLVVNRHYKKAFQNQLEKLKQQIQEEEGYE